MWFSRRKNVSCMFGANYCFHLCRWSGWNFIHFIYYSKGISTSPIVFGMTISISPIQFITFVYWVWFIINNDLLSSFRVKLKIMSFIRVFYSVGYVEIRWRPCNMMWELTFLFFMCFRFLMAFKFPYGMSMSSIVICWRTGYNY